VTPEPFLKLEISKKYASSNCPQNAPVKGGSSNNRSHVSIACDFE